MLRLTFDILYHAGLGIGLALLVWAVGMGYLLLLGESRLPARWNVHAYPVGLLAVTLASLLLLVEPLLGLLGALLLAIPLARLAADTGRVRIAAAKVIPPLAWALPALVGFAAVIGFLLHGPTNRLDSSAGGELMFYVAKLVSARDSVTPFRDLLVEGQGFIYVEAAPSFVGAAVSHVPGFDAFLFQTTALPAFMLASLCIGLGLLGRDRQATPSSGVWTTAVAALAISMIAYPSWLTESPPVALAVPLALPVYKLWADSVPLGWFGALGGVIALDILLTKVVAGIPFAILVLAALYTRYRDRLELRHLAAAVGVLASVAGAAVAVLFLTAGWYVDLFRLGSLPSDAVREVSTDNAASVGLLLEMAGQLLLLAAVVRTNRYSLAAALAISIVAVWFVKGQGFDIAVGMPILLAAFVFWTLPEPDRRTRWLVLGAAVSLSVSAWFRDLAGVRAALVLVLLLGLALLAAFVGSSRTSRSAASLVAYAYAVAAVGASIALAGHQYLGALAVAILLLVPSGARRLPTHARRLAIPAALAASAVATLVIAVVQRDEFGLGRPPPTLTTEDYAVWQRAEKLVPDDGLIFTSLTGRRIEIHQGWNNYPAIAGRQLYLAGWYDGRLISDRAELERRLALNAKVLSGDLRPGRVDLSRAFGAYFAVLRTSERTPQSFKRLYRNRLFALYRIS